jgi:hypothetical protein
LKLNVYGQFGFYKELTGIDVSESFTTVKNRLKKDAKPYGMIMDYEGKYISDHGSQFTIYEGVQNPATGNYEWKTTTISSENDIIVIVVVSIPYWRNTNLALNIVRDLAAKHGIVAHGDNRGFAFKAGDYNGNVMIEYPNISYSIIIEEKPSEKEKRLLKEEKKRQEEEKKRIIMEEEKEFVALLKKISNIDSDVFKGIVTEVVLSKLTPVPIDEQKKILTKIPTYLYENDFIISHNYPDAVDLFNINFVIGYTIKKSLISIFQQKIRATRINYVWKDTEMSRTPQNYDEVIIFADMPVLWSDGGRGINMSKVIQKALKKYGSLYYTDGRMYSIDLEEFTSGYEQFRYQILSKIQEEK